MKKAICSLLIALFLCASVFTVTGRADFGDFGGDSDYGGGWDSGWDSGDSGWDWDDDDDDYDYDYDNDNDYDYGGWNSGGYTSSSGSSDYEFSNTTKMVFGAVFLIVLILVFVLIVKKIVGLFRGKGKSKNSILYPQRQKKVWPVAQRRPGDAPVRSGGVPTGASALRPIADYKKLDPGFSPEAFREQLSNRYVQFQNAWQAKDLSPLRPYLTDALYAQMDRQLENNYRRTRQTNRVERIAVLGVTLTGWSTDGREDRIVARLRTRIVDYVTDDGTGQIVRGSATAEKFMEYEWTLTRASGVVTGQTDGLTVHNCPNCGATLNINQTARCEFCGSIVTVKAHEWAVSNIKGISQRTGK